MPKVLFTNMQSWRRNTGFAEAPTANWRDQGQTRKKTTRECKDERQLATTHVGTWNLQGKLSNGAQRETLSRDMRDQGIAICSLQETHCAVAGEYTTECGDRIITFGRQENGYGGLGFYVAREWVGRVATTRLITERIAVLRLYRNEEEAEINAGLGKRGARLCNN